MKISIHYNRALTKLSTREDASAITVSAEAVNSIRIVKSLGAEDRLAHKYGQHLREALHWGAKHKVLMGVTLGMIVLLNVRHWIS